MPAKLKVDRAEFAELAGKGWTNEQLRAHFKVNATTISRIRKATGTSTAIRLTPERKARIAAMLDDGWSFEEITRTEGADRSTLQRHFPGQQWTNEQAKQYRAALRSVPNITYAQGLTILATNHINYEPNAKRRSQDRQFRAPTKKAA